jgi:hypothetical protein
VTWNWGLSSVSFQNPDIPVYTWLHDLNSQTKHVVKCMTKEELEFYGCIETVCIISDVVCT